MRKSIFSALACAALLAAGAVSCNSNNSVVTYNQSNALLAGNWYFTRVMGNQVPQTSAEEWPRLEFNTQSGSVAGNTGCNQVMGNFNFTNKGTIHFNDMASTRMMCPDMTLEDNLQKALPQVKSYSINGVTGTLYLLGEKGDTLITMTRVNPRTLIDMRQSY